MEAAQDVLWEVTLQAVVKLRVQRANRDNIKILVEQPLARHVTWVASQM